MELFISLWGGSPAGGHLRGLPEWVAKGLTPEGTPLKCVPRGGHLRGFPEVVHRKCPLRGTAEGVHRGRSTEGGSPVGVSEGCSKGGSLRVVSLGGPLSASHVGVPWVVRMTACTGWVPLEGFSWRWPLEHSGRRSYLSQPDGGPLRGHLSGFPKGWPLRCVSWGGPQEVSPEGYTRGGPPRVVDWGGPLWGFLKGVPKGGSLRVVSLGGPLRGSHVGVPWVVHMMACAGWVPLEGFSWR
jgi:hypothetical protein